MPRPGAHKIPSFRINPMKRILINGENAYTTTKQVATHVGVPESVVKAHLIKLRSKGIIKKTSPFYKK